MIMETEKFIYEKSMPTDRGLAKYIEMFDLDIEDCKDKLVLDIGAGTARFQEEAKEEGIRVISLDPVYKFDFSQEQVRKDFYTRAKKLGFGDFIDEDVLKEKVGDVVARLDIGQNPDKQRDKVAGINEALPFKNETFDFVLNAYSSFLYLEKNYSDPSEAVSRGVLMLEQIHNVLKPDGEARISIPDLPIPSNLIRRVSDAYIDKYPDARIRVLFGKKYNYLRLKK